jgi:molybdate transport system permease protein
MVRRGTDIWPWLSVPLLGFLLLPLLSLFLKTPPSNLWASLGAPAVRQAVGLSLATSLPATAAGIVFGTPVAYFLAHRRSRLRRLVDVLIDMPVVLPPSVAGIALLMAFGRRGFLGGLLNALGLQLAFTPLAVVMAQGFVAAPFFVKAAAIGFGQVDPELHQAASLDGAGKWQAFRHVTVPLSWPALLGGAAMMWARAIGEFGATIIFAGNFPGRTQTMPLAIYLGFEFDLNLALTLSVILVGLSIVILVVMKGLLHREVF